MSALTELRIHAYQKKVGRWIIRLAENGKFQLCSPPRRGGERKVWEALSGVALIDAVMFNDRLGEDMRFDLIYELADFHFCFRDFAKQVRQEIADGEEGLK